MVIFPISIFSQIRSEGGGSSNIIFFPKFKIVHIILGVGGGLQENYGLFPQFVTFHIWMTPLNNFWTYNLGSIGKNDPCPVHIPDLKTVDIVTQWSKTKTFLQF